MQKFTKIANQENKALGVLNKALFTEIASFDNEDKADKFVDEANIPKDAPWGDRVDGGVALTVLGYINGLLSEAGVDKKIIVEVDDNDEISKITCDKYG